MKTVRRLLAAFLAAALLCTIPFPTAFAVGNNTNLVLELDKTEAEVGDTVTVTVKNRAMKVCSFTGGVAFDPAKVTCIGINPADACLTDTTGKSHEAVRTSTLETAASQNAVGFGFAFASENTYRAGTLLTVTFEVIGAGNTGFTIYEDSDGSDGFSSEAAETSLLRVTGVDPSEALKGSNLALRAEAIADSVNTEYDGMWIANLNDNDENTRWQSDSRGNEGEDAWFGLRWNAPVLLEYLVVVWEKSHPTADGYLVQISEDGKTWTDTPFRVSRVGVDGEDKQTDTIALAAFPETPYVRLLCHTPMVVQTEDYGEQIKEYPSAYELKAYGISFNLALDAQAGTDSASENAANINDGDINTRWQSRSAGTNEKPAWATLTWDDEKTLETAVICWSSAHPADNGFAMQISSDGKNWTDTPFTHTRSVGEGEYATDAVTFTNKPTTKYLRVYCFDNGEGKYSPVILEFEVYGGMQVNVASDAPLLPTAANVTDHSVTLTKVTGYEYSMDKKTWQKDPYFGSLRPQTAYTFYQRLAATQGKEAGVASIGVLITTKEGESGLPGDVDLDGTVGAADLTALARHVGNIAQLTDQTALLNADTDLDGTIGASDLTKLARFVGGIISSL